MKGVQCHEIFGGIALKNHTFYAFHLKWYSIMYVFIIFILCNAAWCLQDWKHLILVA